MCRCNHSISPGGTAHIDEGNLEFCGSSQHYLVSLIHSFSCHFPSVFFFHLFLFLCLFTTSVSLNINLFDFMTNILTIRTGFRLLYLMLKLWCNLLLIAAWVFFSISTAEQMKFAECGFGWFLFQNLKKCWEHSYMQCKSEKNFNQWKTKNAKIHISTSNFNRRMLAECFKPVAISIVYSMALLTSKFRLNFRWCSMKNLIVLVRNQCVTILCFRLFFTFFFTIRYWSEFE